MFCVGNKKIGKIYIGNKEISKAYLGTQLVFRKNSPAPPPTPSLPYDEEIEYLESTGTQYINTRIVPLPNEECKIVFSCVTNSGGAVLGCRSSSSSGKYILGESETNKNIYATFGTHADQELIPFNELQHTVKLNTGTGKAIIDDGAGISIGTFSENNLNIYLFACNNNGRISMKSSVRIMSIQIGSRLNMIPVRIGPTGYMYDKISGELYDNDGTGVFLLGNDVTHYTAPDNYIKDGLVLWLDGINRNTDGNNWVDLISGHSFSNSGVGFHSTYALFDGTSYLFNGTFTPPLSENGTIEAVFEVDPDDLGSNHILFFPKSTSSSDANIALGYNSSKKYIWSVRTGRSMYNVDSGPTTISISLARAYSNGSQLTSGLFNYWSVLDSGRTNYIGKRGGTSNQYYFKGKVYSIRVYNRQLTQSEILNNANVDNQRFNLGLDIPSGSLIG